MCGVAIRAFALSSALVFGSPAQQSMAHSHLLFNKDSSSIIHPRAAFIISVFSFTCLKNSFPPRLYVANSPSCVRGVWNVIMSHW